MFLFASRPLDTYFFNSPLGWYRYHWEIGTSPNCAEYGNSETKTFFLIHGVLGLLFLCCVVWIIWQYYVVKRASNRENAERDRARKTKNEAVDAYMKAVEAQKKKR